MNKTNNQVILDRLIQEELSASNGKFSHSEYFEIYAASQILKDYDLSYDAIAAGIVGQGGDGGIDSIYTFVNGELLEEDTSINANHKRSHIELIIIQSKTSSGFDEGAITKFRESAEDLFNLNADLKEFSTRYHSVLIDKVILFREAINLLVRVFPHIQIRYFYVTQGEEIHPNVSNKAGKLKTSILNLFSNADFSFEFVTATRLLELSREVPSTSRILNVSESPISTADGSYICLVNLTQYFEFISDSDSDSLCRNIFETNVRDFQGDVTVNTGIKQTLDNKNSDNFWFLNNGVTIITPKAFLAGKQLTIDDPQIVNGLQTSYVIYTHFSELEAPIEDNRSILVRVICEMNEEARDRIIRATNNQTPIIPTSLRSSDAIHRNIEDFLKTNDFFYDRKKNFYKNQGKPIAKIISIAYMAQSMMAITLLQPNNARARPSTLINSNSEYKKIFSLDIPINVYLKVVQIMKAVENFLKSEQNLIYLDRKAITNIRYYVAMVVAINLVQSKSDIINLLSKIPTIQISDQILQAATIIVHRNYNNLGSSDQVAKGSKLLTQLLSLDLSLIEFDINPADYV